MTSPSPSDFLTFSRRAFAQSSRLATRLSSQPSTITPRHSIAASCRIATPQLRYASSGVSTQGYGPGQKKHAVDKGSDDIQSEAKNKAMADRAKATGGEDNTTAQRDTTNATQKAKQDHPEAPDVVIGMQDERGQRGH